MSHILTQTHTCSGTLAETLEWENDIAFQIWLAPTFLPSKACGRRRQRTYSIQLLIRNLKWCAGLVLSAHDFNVIHNTRLCPLSRFFVSSMGKVMGETPCGVWDGERCPLCVGCGVVCKARLDPVVTCPVAVRLVGGAEDGLQNAGHLQCMSDMVLEEDEHKHLRSSLQDIAPYSTSSLPSYP